MLNVDNWIFVVRVMSQGGAVGWGWGTSVKGTSFASVIRTLSELRLGCLLLTCEWQSVCVVGEGCLHSSGYFPSLPPPSL